MRFGGIVAQGCSCQAVRTACAHWSTMPVFSVQSQHCCCCTCTLQWRSASDLELGDSEVHEEEPGESSHVAGWMA